MENVNICSPDTNTDTNKTGDWRRMRTNRVGHRHSEKCPFCKGFCVSRDRWRTFSNGREHLNFFTLDVMEWVKFA
jgi:hypothetical protein